MRHKKSTKAEVPYISYRNYLWHYILLGGFNLLILLMTCLLPSFCNEYANTIYASVAKAVTFFTNAWPAICIADILCYLAIAFGAYIVGWLTYTVVRYRRSAYAYLIRYRFMRTGLNLACIILLMSFFFQTNRGILMGRVDFAHANGMTSNVWDLDSYSNEELTKLALSEIEAASQAWDTLHATTDYDFAIADPAHDGDLCAAGTLAYSQTRLLYPGLADLTIKPKKDYALGLTALLHTDSYSTCYTSEAYYRPNLAPAHKPYAIAKAMAGLSGYTTQKDVAAIAYYICQSGNAEYQYSGHLMAIHALYQELSDRKAQDAISCLNAVLTPSLRDNLPQ